MQLRLTIESGTLAGREFTLETGFLTIGRGDQCSIRFDPLSERIASKQHAYINAQPDGFYITDNQSTNGTLLNGNRIETARLTDGDIIQFGKNGVRAKVSIGAQSNVDPPCSVSEGYGDEEAVPFDMSEVAPAKSVQLSISQLGLGGTQTAPQKPAPIGKYIGIAITIPVILILTAIVALIMYLSLDLGPALVATVVAFTPAFLYLIPFMLLDRYDPEPLWLLALAFAWGALVAVLVSIVANTAITIVAAIGAAIAGLPPELGMLVGAVLSAPIFEEGSKGVGLLILLIFFRRYFDDVLDGIVFAGVIALGFATVENVLYYGNGLRAGGWYGLGILFLMRGILSPFAHATFTSVTGIGCGISRESHKGFVRFIMPILGYIGAVSLHMFWNGMAAFSLPVVRGLGLTWTCEYIGLAGENEPLCAFSIGYTFLEVPLFFFFVIFALIIMRRQNRILREMLALDVARGLIPSEHERKATSVFRSLGWLAGGLFSGKFFARSRYLRSLGKLGLSYWHIQRATAAQGQTGSFQQNPILREEILNWRDKV
jgi:RsiW-degrading membrane proteinase PrsW (M82 family)